MELIIVSICTVLIGYALGRCHGADRREAMSAKIHHRDCIIADWVLTAEQPAPPLIIRHHDKMRRYELLGGNADRNFIVASFPYSADSGRAEAYALAADLYETMLRFRHYAEP